METEIFLLDDEPCCAACGEVFNAPLVPCCISCSSGFCTPCLSRFSRACPFCRDDDKSSLRQCGEHGAELTLFCVRELRPICTTCHKSGVYKNHRVYLLRDGADDCKVGIITEISILIGQKVDWSEGCFCTLLVI